MSTELESVEDLEKLDLIGTKEVCRILKINRYTLYKLLEEGKLHGYRFANKYLFDRKDILDFVKKHRI